MKSDLRIRALDEKAIQVAKVHRNCEAELIGILQDIDKLRGYLHFESTSLHDYAIRRLKISEATACNLIAVARKALEVPELKVAIEAGELSVSKARKITPVLTVENKAAWLEIAKTKTSREIEKAVATEKPETLIVETAKYRASDRIELKVGVSEEFFRKLERIKDLEAQRTSKAVNIEAALLAMAELYLEKCDPVMKAERAERRKGTVKTDFVTRACARSVPGQTIRAPLPSAVKHAVALRDLRRCTYKYRDGNRCECTRWLDVHHVVPVTRGGSNEIANLTTLCSSHHRLMHRH